MFPVFNMNLLLLWVKFKYFHKVSYLLACVISDLYGIVTVRKR